MSNQSSNDPLKFFQTLAGILGMVVGATATIVGSLIWLGGWKADTEYQLKDQNKRLEKVEVYVPTIIGMQHDVQYLADRARQEDSRKGKY